MQSWIHVIDWRATVRPDAPALIDDRGSRYTYRELWDALELRAGGWSELGVGAGDVVAVMAKNSADFLVHALALMRVGAVPAFINWRMSPSELTGLFELLEPVAVAADAEFVPSVEKAGGVPGATVVIGGGDVPDGWTGGGALSAPPPPRPPLTGEEVMALLHTSGTTGRPKGIPLRHNALVQALSAFALEIGDQVAGSRHLQIMPLFHLAGFGQALQTFLTAGTLYVHTVFEPPAVVDAIERDRIEFFTAGPSLIDMLVAEVRRRETAPELGSIREIAYGSAPITPSSLEAALEVLGCRFRQIYGNSECQSMVSLLAPEDHRPDHPHLGSAGRIVYGWEVRVVDAAGAEVPAGTPGELLIRGETLLRGYWRDPEATREAFTADGYYRTGDVVRLTPDRYLYVLDRAKDMIISGGENVYPAEVEAALSGHPGVREAAVIGVPHPRWGEAVHALIVPEPGAAVGPDEIVAWCRDRLAGFKCPKTVRFTDDLPRTTTGKVLKRELRRRHADAAGRKTLEEPAR
ncbi:fatty acid--CoA ligase [Actinomadura sp. KC345]|uniref:class I adenylate-forming enzyme family protein n=1 Tax=Actinomadura sp. KC345 TaxID=2530371 RepID=UPI00104DEB3A|nr:AMP-binding protein [Actinomadura sp. KC345]TDC48908.1 fatty acid--CoA ligase [Actinomadura sp. KC345]